LSVRSSAANEWELACTNATEVRKGLMEMALQHNLNIVSLQSAEQRLEDVFRNLTGNKPVTL
jgi:ABC-2 type transport system ATP-binding protein